MILLKLCRRSSLLSSLPGHPSRGLVSRLPPSGKLKNLFASQAMILLCCLLGRFLGVGWASNIPAESLLLSTSLTLFLLVSPNPFLEIQLVVLVLCRGDGCSGLLASVDFIEHSLDDTLAIEVDGYNTIGWHDLVGLVPITVGLGCSTVSFVLTSNSGCDCCDDVLWWSPGAGC